MLCIYLKRYFKSLICWLDLCLSSLLVAFISLCFSSLKNSFSSSSIASEQILDRFSSIEPFFLLVSIDLIAISIHWGFGFLLDRCSTNSSIHQKNFCLANRFSIASWSIEVFFSSTDPQQHFDRFISVKI